MKTEQETKVVHPVGQDPNMVITEETLTRDSAKIVEEVQQFYKVGEVEVTVLLSFPNQNRSVIVSTSIRRGERLRWVYDTARSKIPFLTKRDP